jgi:hypothetical protein
LQLKRHSQRRRSLENVTAPQSDQNAETKIDQRSLGVESEAKTRKSKRKLTQLTFLMHKFEKSITSLFVTVKMVYVDAQWLRLPYQPART